MGRTILMLCVGILFCSPAAFAQDWKFFYEREEIKYYFDKATIQRPDRTTLRVTERTTKKVEDEDDEKKKDDEGAKPGEVEVARAEYEINCKDRSFKILSVTALDPETGKEVAAEAVTQKPGARMGVYTYDRIGALYENLCP